PASLYASAPCSSAQLWWSMRMQSAAWSVRSCAWSKKERSRSCRGAPARASVPGSGVAFQASRPNRCKAASERKLGGELPPSPGFAGYSPDYAARLRGGEFRKTRSALGSSSLPGAGVTASVDQVIGGQRQEIHEIIGERHLIEDAPGLVKTPGPVDVLSVCLTDLCQLLVLDPPHQRTINHGSLGQAGAVPHPLPDLGA